MRSLSPSLCLAAALSLATPLTAQEVDRASCLEGASIVQYGVNARAEGQSRAKVRRVLREALDDNAGDQLTDFIFALPEDQLTDAVGQAWAAQCPAS